VNVTRVSIFWSRVQATVRSRLKAPVTVTAAFLTAAAATTAASTADARVPAALADRLLPLRLEAGGQAGLLFFLSAPLLDHPTCIEGPFAPPHGIHSRIDCPRPSHPPQVGSSRERP